MCPPKSHTFLRSFYQAVLFLLGSFKKISFVESKPYLPIIFIPVIFLFWGISGSIFSGKWIISYLKFILIVISPLNQYLTISCSRYICQRCKKFNFMQLAWHSVVRCAHGFSGVRYVRCPCQFPMISGRFNMTIKSHYQVEVINCLLYTHFSWHETCDFLAYFFSDYFSRDPRMEQQSSNGNNIRSLWVRSPFKNRRP